MEIVYSYWDGSGHRRSTILKKGNTIQQFLYRCLEQLRKENQFNELKVQLIRDFASLVFINSSLYFKRSQALTS